MNCNCCINCICKLLLLLVTVAPPEEEPSLADGRYVVPGTWIWRCFFCVSFIFLFLLPVVRGTVLYTIDSTWPGVPGSLLYLVLAPVLYTVV